MLELTRLNGTKLYINADLIMTVEETPDSVVTLTNGEKWIVSDRGRDIQQRYIEYKQQTYKAAFILRPEGEIDQVGNPTQEIRERPE